ncbi:MAG: hypothetical protein ACRCV3_04965 [Desulfovibrionaceae bacterium]
MAICAHIYDILRDFWENDSTQRFLTAFLVVLFLFSLFIIELSKFNVFPSWMQKAIPSNHFASISLVFTCLLAVEVIGLVFSIAYSISRSLRMQLEILALILLRNAFKGLGTFNETFLVNNTFDVISQIISSAVAALIIFICVIVYRGLKIKMNLTPDIKIKNYVLAKKTVSLCLLIIVIMLAGFSLFERYILHSTTMFFEYIYTSLIFADILLVLIAQYYVPSFLGMFRNSGFVICTLLIRISLTAPSFWMPILGVFAALYALSLTWVTRRFVHYFE